jgi:hypothetical protein
MKELCQHWKQRQQRAFQIPVIDADVTVQRPFSSTDFLNTCAPDPIKTVITLKGIQAIAGQLHQDLLAGGKQLTNAAGDDHLNLARDEHSYWIEEFSSFAICWQ